MKISLNLTAHNLSFGHNGPVWAIDKFGNLKIYKNSSEASKEIDYEKLKTTTK